VIVTRTDLDGKPALQILQAEYLRARNEGQADRQVEIREAIDLVHGQFGIALAKIEITRTMRGNR
jgi:hypothetical protein